MKKIIRLTERDLTRLVKRVIKETQEVDQLIDKKTGAKHYDYKQKYGHSLLSKDGKKFNLPSGHIWKHRCFEASEADWLEDEEHGIVFNCGDLDSMLNDEPNLKDFKGSESLKSTLKSQYCLGNTWNNSVNSKYPGCATQLMWNRQGTKF